MLWCGVLTKLWMQSISLSAASQATGCGGAVLVKQLLGLRREKSHDVKERALLLDDGVNGDVLERDRHGHWNSFCGRRSGDVSRLGMIPKSGYRFSGKIMLKQRFWATIKFN